MKNFIAVVVSSSDTNVFHRKSRVSRVIGYFLHNEVVQVVISCNLVVLCGLPHNTIACSKISVVLDHPQKIQNRWSTR
jgi:hypothetical protein